MSKLTDRILVGVYVALAALPVTAMVTGIRGREIFGVLDPTPRPTPTLATVTDEKFQHAFVAWFEHELGLKGVAVAADNAVLYHVFRETKTGAFVRLGKQRVLFPHEDINYYNKHGEWAPDPAYIDDLARQIADVQVRLRAQHRAFVPVIIPSKSTVWRDALPERWVVDLPSPRPSDETTRLVREALDRHGVRYVDAVKMFAESPLPRRDLFGPDARHWSGYGACLANSAVLSLYAELTGAPRPAHACNYERSFTIGRVDDFDLKRVLNAYAVYRSIKDMPLVTHPPPPPGAPVGPRTLYIGTSFCWWLLYDAEASRAFGRASFNYYNQTFVDGPEGARHPVVAGDGDWRRLTLGNHLYVLDLFESYLGGRGSYVELFLRELRAELDRGGG